MVREPRNNDARYTTHPPKITKNNSKINPISQGRSVVRNRAREVWYHDAVDGKIARG